MQYIPHNKLWLGWLIFTIAINAILIFGLCLVPYVDDPAANRCLMLYIIIISLYVGSLVPFYSVSLIVPLLVVLMRVARDSVGNLMPPAQSASFIVTSMFDSTALTILGSFALAAAMHKYKILHFVGLDRWLGGMSNPAWQCLVTMVVTLLGCLLMYNSSVSFLIHSLLLPQISSSLQAASQIVQAQSKTATTTTTPPTEPSVSAKSVDSHSSSSDPIIRSSKALLASITVAANIGGLLLPLSSPQSQLAYYELIKHLDANRNNQILIWWKWLASSLPLALLATIASWITICLIYGLFTIKPLSASNSFKHTSRHDLTEKSNLDETIQPGQSNFKLKQGFVGLTSLLILVIFALTPLVHPIFGNMGMIALIPILLYFGTSILSDNDLIHLRWDIFLLCLGGIGLIEAVRASGLIHTFTSEIVHILNYTSTFGAKNPSDTFTFGQLYLQAAFLALFIALSAVFKSRFITGLIFLPILSDTLLLQKKSTSLVPIYLVTTFACSAGFVLPSSGIVNRGMASIVDPWGQPILRDKDFFKFGLPCTIITLLLILLLAYPISAFVWA